MSLEQTLNQLESIRVHAENNFSDDYFLALQIIDILLEHIDNEQLRNKVDEIAL